MRITSPKKRIIFPAVVFQRTIFSVHRLSKTQYDYGEGGKISQKTSISEKSDNARPSKSVNLAVVIPKKFRLRMVPLRGVVVSRF